MLTFRHFKYLYCCSMVLFTFVLHAQTYRTGIDDRQLMTLVVHPVNNWQADPVIKLNGEDRLLVAFDELSHEYKRFGYRIIHCDKNWKKSSLNPIEYLEGFSENEIEASGTSINTLTNYTHYSLLIPNDHVSLKLSGNYALEVFDRDESGKTLLTACFSLLDYKVAIRGSVTANTDMDTEQDHQQIRFEVSPLGWSVRQPETEIGVIVRQNREAESEIKNILPNQISPDNLVYDHIEDLIFEGGNEFRRFEITTFKHAGIGVNKVALFTPYYNAELMESQPRTEDYRYDQDQNGRFLIHNTEYASTEISSDYFLVHFSYPMETPFIDGGLYLDGDLVGHRLDQNSKLSYDFNRKAYERTLFLKQGSYNYRYKFVPSSGGRPSIRKTEGSYWQTENEYSIFVYYRPIGGRYDQLIGHTVLKTAF